MIYYTGPKKGNSADALPKRQVVTSEEQMKMILYDVHNKIGQPRITLFQSTNTSCQGMGKLKMQSEYYSLILLEYTFF